MTCLRPSRRYPAGGANRAVTDELRQMLAHARRTADEWNDFLEAFVDDEELIARIKAKSPR
ncbi:hypothetical protein CN235_34460 [Sinorhizobium meliloti]|nr:hypothetical protein CN235_34460 [Sinorhizobium meliloti]